MVGLVVALQKLSHPIMIAKL